VRKVCAHVAILTAGVRSGSARRPRIHRFSELARAVLLRTPMKKRALALLFLAVACSTGAKSKTAPAPGSAVTTTPDPARVAEAARLQAKLDAVKSLDAAGFASRYGLNFTTDLGYAPLEASGYDRVKASGSFATTAAEETALARDGFVITDRVRFPSFAYGYQTIYTAHLPVFVSADSILFAVHKSFDAILKSVESEVLVPALSQLINGMRSALGAGAANDLPARARDDVDVYLSVCASLLTGSFAPPVSGGDASAAKSLYEKAIAGQGHDFVTLFGDSHPVDFSQFTPRGHYADSPELSRYFQATMWLGRTDLRIIDTKPDRQVFQRAALDGAYIMRALMNADSFATWKKIDDLIGGFIGEHDNMTVSQLDSLLADLGVARAADLATLSDGAIAQAIVSGSYGVQRIPSQLMEGGLMGGTTPLPHAFLLFGQRYTLDSYVFSNVIWDRVHSDPKRMMPNPLDVGFAALANNQAGLLLGDELAKYSYAPALASMRILADEHPAEYWDANLYNEWMSMQRALSTSTGALPRVTGTEAWGRRVLSTQLASWTELRHDTMLYVKQSYGFTDGCEYPDAYVEPYPEFFTRLAAFATKGAELTAGLPRSSGAQQTYATYFEQLRSVAATLEAMAKNQRTGAPHTAEQIAFINQLLYRNGCAGSAFDGWYAKLFYDASARDASAVDNVIADVHTQPSDEDGNDVGRILHVATWLPRTLIFTAESCSGARAYVGLVSSYHEVITEKWLRLGDDDWRSRNSPDGHGGWVTPPEVPWLSAVVAH
jgi:hypothetical protein